MGGGGPLQFAEEGKRAGQEGGRGGRTAAFTNVKMKDKGREMQFYQV